MFNDAQRDAVHSDDNILVCATAGSGKTTVLAEKAKNILRKNRDAHILLVTFSREAAMEMAERIKRSRVTPAIHSSQLRRITFGTYHSLALRQLKSAGKVKKILSGLEIRHAVQRSLWDAKLKIPADVATEMIATCKCNPEYEEENPEISDLAALYQSHLEAMGGMDFSDILLNANRLMRNGLCQPLHATHVLADEYQDTDAIQAEWLERHFSGGRLACAVGDDDQSIYAFRRSLGYKGMQRFIHATRARIINLDTNYRSTSGIVFTAGRLIEKNTDRLQKDFKVSRGEGPKPTLVTLTKDQDQASEIARFIKTLCKDNPIPEELEDKYSVYVNPGEVAVLSRTNMQLDDIEDACRRMSIPFYRNGALFWDLKILQTYLLLLQSLDKREGAGLEIGLRWAGMTDIVLRKMSAAAGGNLWAYAAPTGPIISEMMPRYVTDLLRRFREYTPRRTGEKASGAVMAIDSIADWMSAVITGSLAMTSKGVCREPKKRELKPSEKSALNALTKGRDALRRYDGSLRARINKVLSSGSTKDRSGVALATFHASKGLEFKHVLLSDIDAGSVPSSEADESLAALEEERRIFFVAMTRARDTLTLYRSELLPVSEFLWDAGLYSD